MITVRQIKLGGDELGDWDTMIQEIELTSKGKFIEGYSISGDAEDITFMVFECPPIDDDDPVFEVEETIKEVDDGNCISKLEVDLHGTRLTIRYIANY